MASNAGKTLIERMRAPFVKGAGLPKRNRFANDGWDNDFTQRSQNAAGSAVLDLIGTDGLNNRLVAGEVYRPVLTPVKCQIQANGKIATTNPFFVNNNETTPVEIAYITCQYSTAAGSASTGTVVKDPVGVAPGAGATCMSGTFNLNTTTNTEQIATLAGSRGWPSLVLGPGEQLTLKISAVASLAGLYVTVWLRPRQAVSLAAYHRHANGDIATGVMFLNILPGTVVRGVAMRWGTAATNAGAVTMDITKDSPGTAPGAGTSILAAAQSVKGTANTTVYPALSATAANLSMAVGDMLSVKTAGTLTALADLVITVFFAAGPSQHIIIPVSSWDAANTDRCVFQADDNYYQVVDCWQTWSTVSTSNTQLLTKDTGTTAPGGGTGLQTDNTNAGILTSGTVNTPIGSLLLTAVSTKPTLWLGPGDRLGLKNAGTVGSLAGVFTSILLRKV
jgi:hypothetical protein